MSLTRRGLLAAGLATPVGARAAGRNPIITAPAGRYGGCAKAGSACFAASVTGRTPARAASRRRSRLRGDAESRVENDPCAWERELFARVPYIQPGA